MFKITVSTTRSRQCFVSSSTMRCIFVFLVIICVVCAEETSVERRKKYSFWYRGGVWALVAFVAIKAKIIIAITVATWFFTLGMKALMALKYGKDYIKCGREEIIFHPPTSYSHDFPGTLEYPPDHSSDTYGLPDSYGPPNPPKTESNYEKYGRKMDMDEIFEKDYSTYMKKLLKKVDLTEYAFESMNMTDEACKRKFVCEMDLYSKRSTLLSFSLIFFSDQGLDRYRNDSLNARTLRQCAKYYPECTS